MSRERSRGDDDDAGYSCALAESDVFDEYPEPPERDVYAEDAGGGGERFMQKQYPMLYAQLNPAHLTDVSDVRCVDDRCSLCNGLDQNTLDALTVLKPGDVREYLAEHGHEFTATQVNVHMAHAVRGEDNVVGVLQNMAVDLIGRVYAVASASSARIMNRVTTDKGRVLFITDHDHARVHNDAVKQFIGLAAACQTLLKHKATADEKPSSSPLL